MIAIPISIFSLLTISVDRYKTVSDPLSRFKNSQLVTPTRALIVIAIIWLYCPLWPFRPFLMLFFRWWSKGFFYFLIYRTAVKNNRSTKRGTFPSTWKPFKDEKRCIWEMSKRLRRLQCSFWRCSSAGNLTFIFRCWCYRRRKLGIVSSRSFPGTINVRFEAFDLNIVKQPHYK